MTTVVVPKQGRKRTRQELETDIDNLEIKLDDTCWKSPSKKKHRKAMDHCTQILNVTTATTMETTTNQNEYRSRKRTISQTDFGEKEQIANANACVGENPVNQRPNKKMKTQQTMVADQKDKEESEIAEADRDVLMHCVQKSSTSAIIDALDNKTPQAIKLNYPTFRVRRSGLEFCVQCGISGMVA